MLYADEALSSPITTVNGVVGLDEMEQAKVLSYLQGMVYMWCAINGDKTFAVRDLVGGENYDWQGTPLMTVWHNRKRRYQEQYPDAPSDETDEWTHNQTAKEVGWLLKKVLIDDKRVFVEYKGFGNQYRWQK